MKDVQGLKLSCKCKVELSGNLEVEEDSAKVKVVGYVYRTKTMH